MKCSTCAWNFKGNCANVYYGVPVRRIIMESRVCNDWKESLEEFSRKRELIKQLYVDR